MKILNILTISSILIFTACGGGSSSTSSVVEGATATSFQNKELYSFNLNFVDSRQRYDLKKIDKVKSLKVNCIICQMSTWSKTWLQKKLLMT